MSKYKYKRSRCFSLVVYYSPELLERFILCQSSIIDHYAFILHDSDSVREESQGEDTSSSCHSDSGETSAAPLSLQPDVEPEHSELNSPSALSADFKPLHVHLIVHFRWQHTVDYVLSLFRLDDQNVFCQSVTDKRKVYRYLTHKDDPDKFQYSDDLVHTDDTSFWVNESPYTTADITCLLNDLLNPFITYPELIARYGRDFVIHYKKYRYMAGLIHSSTIPYDDVREAFRLGLD